jgi:SAM-dependent methyltransferase
MSGFDFEQVFGDDYLHFYEAVLTEERSQREADLIVRLLDLGPGARVLDIPCGYGRIAERLAEFGCDVVGVDHNRRFLEVAQQRGGLVDYRLADMRQFAPDAEFDAIVNWFTSFGYFDEAVDRAILATWRRALKPGGKLIIDHQNRQRLLAVMAATGGDAVALTQRGDDLLVDRTSFDLATSRTNTERITVREGRVRRYPFTVRTFSFTELRDWLLQAGFADVVGYGPEGDPFALTSRRMVVVATT